MSGRPGHPHGSAPVTTEKSIEFRRDCMFLNIQSPANVILAAYNLLIARKSAEQAGSHLAMFARGHIVGIRYWTVNHSNQFTRHPNDSVPILSSHSDVSWLALSSKLTLDFLSFRSISFTSKFTFPVISSRFFAMSAHLISFCFFKDNHFPPATTDHLSRLRFSSPSLLSLTMANLS